MNRANSFPEHSKFRSDLGNGRRLRTAAFVCLLFLCAPITSAIGILLFAAGTYSARDLTVFLGLQILMIALVSIMVSIAMRIKIDPFAPFMLVNATYFLYFCLRPIYLISTANQLPTSIFVSRNPATPLDYAWAVGYECLGLFCFHVGYYSLGKRLSNQPAPPNVSRWNARRTRCAVLAGGALGLISTAITVLVSGGVAETLASVGHLRDVTSGYAYFLLGTAYFPIGVVLLLANHLLGHRSRIALACFFIASVGYAAFFGNRTGIAALILSCIILYASVRGNRGVWKFALSSSLIVVLVTPPLVFWAFAREYNMDVSDIPKVIAIMRKEDPRVFYAQVMGEFSAVDSFAAILHAGPSVFPFRFGETYLDVATFVVPRSLWPSKPKYFASAVGDYVTDNGNDVPPGQVGELYVNFHIVGIVAGMLLIGRLFGALYVTGMAGGMGRRAFYSMLLPYALAFLTHDAVAGIVILLTSVIPMWPALAYIQSDKRYLLSGGRTTAARC